MKDTKTGYSVDERYFEELKASIMTRVGQEPAKIVSWRGAMKSLMSLAAGFILLVAITSTVYYFTTRGSEVAPTVELSDSEVIMLYDIDTEDIINPPTELTISADDALAYVELYGYPSE